MKMNQKADRLPGTVSYTFNRVAQGRPSIACCRGEMSVLSWSGLSWALLCALLPLS